MYFGTDTTIEGNVNVPGVGRIDFEVDQGPEHPWNALVGANLGFRENFELFLEYGFNFDDINIFVAGATYRF